MTDDDPYEQEAKVEKINQLLGIESDDSDFVEEAKCLSSDSSLQDLSSNGCCELRKLDSPSEDQNSKNII